MMDVLIGLCLVGILIAVIYTGKKDQKQLKKEQKDAMEGKQPQRITRHTAPDKNVGKTRTFKLCFRFLNRKGDSVDDEWYSAIAGLMHHSSKSDIGGFCGYIANDSGNEVDPDAMAICTETKVVGYIPAKDLKSYRKWCGGKTVPCMGYLFEEDGYIRGRVKALLPCNADFIKNEFERYADWIVENWGEEYCPKDFNFTIEREDKPVQA